MSRKRTLILLPLTALLAVLASGCVLITSFFEVGNTRYFSGTVDNFTGLDILEHNMTVQLLNSSNGLEGGLMTVPGCLRSWQSGTDSFFDVTTTNDDAAKAIVKLKFDSTFRVGQTEDGDVTISNLVISRDDNTLTVTGTIRNDDNDELEDARVCVVVRNDDDDVIRAQRDNDTFDLDPDETANFSVTVTVPDDNNDVDTVDVHVDGLKDDVPIDPESDLNNSITECPDAPTSTPTGSPTATATNTPDPAITTTPTATSTPDPCD